MEDAMIIRRGGRLTLLIQIAGGPRIMFGHVAYTGLDTRERAVMSDLLSINYSR
jgi:hypothetical protein